jgi:predicted transcriptional regulator
MRRPARLEVRMSRAEMRRLDRLAGERHQSRSGLIRSLIAAEAVQSEAEFAHLLADLPDPLASVEAIDEA